MNDNFITGDNVTFSQIVNGTDVIQDIEEAKANAALIIYMFIGSV